MKKIYYYVCTGIIVLLVGACAKDASWNQDGEVADSQKGTIIGQLINDDDNQPLKGIKILFERQTTVNGGQTFVDTVSTDTEGKFSYQIPFPNKVKVSVRDVGRYAADEHFIEVLEHKEYQVTMNSHPRFGVMPIKVHVNNADLDEPFENMHVSLWVRETEDESYSMVESLSADAEGNVQFDEIAWPVYYEVRIEEEPNRYFIDKLSGQITTKDPLNLTLNTYPIFGTSDISTTVVDADNIPYLEVDVALYTRQVGEEEYEKVATLTTDIQGKVNFKNIDFPIEYKIVLDEIEPAYDYDAIEGALNKQRQNVHETIVAKANFGRYWKTTPSSVIGENTLVAFYEGVKIQEMEVDSQGNIYGVTTDGNLVRIPQDGSAHKILATGFKNPWGIAIQDDNTMYVVENTDGHSIYKVIVNPATDAATVSLFAGNGSSSGTTDGVGTAARFNRPSDAVYDPSRNCLWVVEWSGTRIRKVDVQTAEVSTLATGTGFGLGLGMTSDHKYLYIASHTSPAGVVKYDIDNKEMYTVRTGYSIRHIAVTPNNDVYFNINRYQAKVYKITDEVLVSGNGSNGSSTFETVAGNGSWGTLPAIGWQGNADRTIANNNVDGSPNGIAYDSNRGRLYFSVVGDSRIYYLKSSKVPN